MLDKESYILSDLLGQDSPEVRALTWMARDPKQADAARRLLRGLCRRRGINPDEPPAFGLPNGLSPGFCPIGRARCGDLRGDVVALAEQEFRAHIAVFGSTNQGKTTLIKMIVEGFCGAGDGLGAGRRSAFVIDPHGEYRDLLVRLPPGTAVWMTADDLGLSPFEVPRDEHGIPAMDPAKWIGQLQQWIRLTWLNDPSCNFFAETVTRIYEERGVFTGTADYPCLSDIIEAVAQDGARPGSDRARAREKVLDRLSALSRMLPGLDVRKSRNVHQLFGHTVILDVTDVKDVALPILFSFLVTLLSCSFRAESQDPPKRLLGLEEAHLLLGGQTDKRTEDVREGEATGSLRSLRKAGFCAIVSNQLVSDLAKPVLGNLNTVICMRLTRSQCVREAASMLGLKGWQAGKLGAIEPREAIVRLSRHADPIHLAVTEVGDDRLRVTVSRTEAAERSKPLLDAIPFEARPEPETQDNGVAAEGGPQRTPGTRNEKGCHACMKLGLKLNRSDHKVLEAICEEPAESIQDRCDRLGLRREIETPARRRLMNQGLVKKAGSFGNRRSLFEPSAAGRKWAAIHDIRVHKYHGSLVHEYCTRLAEKKLAKAAPGTRFQRRNTGQPGGVRPDSLAILPGRDGARVAIQTVVGHNPTEEAANLTALHRVTRERADAEGRVAILDLVVCVAIDKRVQASIKRALKGDSGGALPDGIVVLNVEDHLVDPAFDWADVLDQET